MKVHLTTSDKKKALSRHSARGKSVLSPVMPEHVYECIVLCKRSKALRPTNYFKMLFKRFVLYTVAVRNVYILIMKVNVMAVLCIPFFIFTSYILNNRSP